MNDSVLYTRLMCVFCICLYILAKQPIETAILVAADAGAQRDCLHAERRVGHLACKQRHWSPSVLSACINCFAIRRNRDRLANSCSPFCSPCRAFDYMFSFCCGLPLPNGSILTLDTFSVVQMFVASCSIELCRPMMK